mgnify:CR=1 FL=1
MLISNGQKHASMNEIPHPLINDESTITGLYPVVMLDPVCQLVRDLSDLRDAGEDIVDIILNTDYIKIDNVPLVRVSPDSLMIVSGKWKKNV